MLALSFFAAHVVSSSKAYCLKIGSSEGDCNSQYTFVSSVEELLKDMNETEKLTQVVLQVFNGEMEEPLQIDFEPFNGISTTIMGSDSSTRIELIIPPYEMSFPKLIFQDLLDVHLTETMPDAAIAVKNMFTSNTCFTGEADVLPTSLTTDLKSLSGLTKLGAQNVVLTFSSVNTQAFIFTPFDTSSGSLTFTLQDFITDTKVEMTEKGLVIYANSKKLITLSPKISKFNIIFDKKSGTITVKETDKLVTGPNVELTLKNSVTAEIETTKSNDFSIKAVDSCFLNILGSSVINTISLQDAETEFTTETANTRIKNIYIEGKSFLFILSTFDINVETIKIQNGTPAISATNDISIACNDLYMNNLTYSKNFGQNIYFHINSHFSSYDADFTVPMIDFDENAAINYDIDDTPRDGIFIQREGFKFPKFTSLFLKDYTYTPPNDKMERLVTEPTYLLCAPDLQCANNTLILQNSEDVHGFNENSNLVKPFCKQHPTKPDYKCFGFQLEDYPADVYPTACLTESSQQTKCPAGTTFIENGADFSEVIKGKTAGLTVFGVAPSNKKKLTIDFASTGRKINWTIEGTQNSTQFNLQLTDKTGNYVDCLKLKKGEYTAAFPEGSADLILNALTITDEAMLTDSFKGIGLENVKDLFLPFKYFDKFTLDGVDKATFNITEKFSSIEFDENMYRFTKMGDYKTTVEVPIAGDSYYAFYPGTSDFTITKLSDEYKPIYLEGFVGEITIDSTWSSASKPAAIFRDGYQNALSVKSDNIPFYFQSDSSFSLTNAGIYDTIKLPAQRIRDLRIRFLNNNDFTVLIENPTLRDECDIEAYYNNNQAGNLAIKNPKLEEVSTVHFKNVEVKGTASIPANSTLLLENCRIADATIKANAIFPTTASHINVKDPRDQLPFAINVAWSISSDREKIMTLEAGKNVLANEEVYYDYSLVTKFLPETQEFNGKKYTAKASVTNNKFIFKAETDDSSSSISGKSGSKVAVIVSVSIIAVIVVAVCIFLAIKFDLLSRLKCSHSIEYADLSEDSMISSSRRV